MRGGRRARRAAGLCGLMHNQIAVAVVGTIPLCQGCIDRVEAIRTDQQRSEHATARRPQVVQRRKTLATA